MESALITTPPRVFASLIANADLPDAVGPAMRIAPIPTSLTNGPHDGISQDFMVATLVANPARLAVTDALVARAASALGDETQHAVLASGIAADLFPHAEILPAIVEARLRAEIGDEPVDIVIQPVAQRRKKLFLADMDSTMIGQECIDELADFVGLKAEVSAITERAMNGEIAFEPALRERVALLRNLPVGVVDEIMESRITLTPGGRALVQTMRANGGYTCLVSGGFTLFTGPVASRIGFHEHRSNTLIVEGERLSGLVQEPILGREAKLATLIELRDRLGLPATRPWLWAMAPTTLRCWARPASVWHSAPSRPLPLRHMRGSTMGI